MAESYGEVYFTLMLCLVLLTIGILIELVVIIKELQQAEDTLNLISRLLDA